MTFLHHDQLGSTRLITSTSGANVGSYRFDPYGTQTAKTGTATTPLGYAGQYTDAESGLIYMRARYYDPATGTFTSPDPIGSLGSGQNLYGYVGGDPVNFVDPSGLLLGGVGGFLADAGKFVYDNAGTIVQIGAATVCIVGTVGTCLGVVGGLLLANVGWNASQLVLGEECFSHAAGDVGREVASLTLSTIPGARLAYAGNLSKYALNRAGEWGVKTMATGAPGFAVGQDVSLVMSSGTGCGC